MGDRDVNPDDVIRGAAGIAIVGAGTMLGPALLLGLWGWKNPQRVRQIGPWRWVRIGLAMVFVALALWLLLFSSEALLKSKALQEPVFAKWPSVGIRWINLGRVFTLGWLLCGGIASALLPALAYLKRPHEFIRSEDFQVRIRNFRKIRQVFEDSSNVPIGVDVRTGSVVTLSEQRRSSHVIVLGATGSGKTILLCNQVLHAIRHGLPCLVIDPKGEDSTLQMIRSIGEKLAQDFEARLKVFRMSNPAASCSYNPLKHGTANQLKDRILEALNWSEQYYQSIAGDFLTVFTACYEKLGAQLTLDTVSRVLGEKREQHDVLRRLKDQMKEGDGRSEELFRRLSVLLEKMKAEDLMGLQAQLSILNNPTIGHKLSFSSAVDEIDLREVLRQGQIAYFQLDTLGNPDTARRLGRMIVEDIKGLASEVYRTVPEDQRRFFPIFIDEFGSFASREFIEVLKQIRGARFATHLFTQGLEDLDAVSKEFRRQAGSNPITKIGFRLDDNETVNEVCSMAGTVETTEQSYQIEGTFAPMKTGLGNLRETRQMRVEHDVFKNLQVGQAVVIEKSPSRVSPIEVFHPSMLSHSV